ncbi:amino acid adenylation domain-containing protein, partial [Bacillus wiedmannii]|uniref:amino acid adenylation domain-containing protein n=1 Tax=Bacillus wiedmannii TaxID=1890302 RepID=UPI002E20F8B4|nr:amino acid adenylation domain-containing protein [Bacillus wiedmannii]
KLPKQRIEFMLRDSKTEFILGQKKLLDTVEFNGNKIFVDSESSYHINGNNLEEACMPNNLAYVIYTSGSTGTPKGVMIEHHTYSNASFSWRDAYNLKAFPIRLLQVANFSFDVFAGDLVKSLLNGGQLHICPDEVKVQPEKLYQYIHKHQINVLDSSPSLILPLLKHVYESGLDISCMKVLIFGGDSCPVYEFNKIVDRFGDTMRVINGYGVTEATVESSYYERKLHFISQVNNLPIGKPLPNQNMYVLNSRLQVQPIGVAGELFIGGKGLARGYLGNPTLTAEKFVENPFIPGNKMYRTGDLVRWLPDGNLEFLGRIDHQVKIRGYRIELGEIEHQLLKHEDVEEAVVIARADEVGEKYLCGYVVTKCDVPVTELRQALLAELPEYMVPYYFIQLEKFPLNTNGKIDRKVLPAPDWSSVGSAEYVAPRNKTEEQLVDIWQEVLSLKHEIGVHENFFELGGHSLRATSLLSKVHKQFDVELPLKEVFTRQTIAELAAYIDQSNKSVYSAITRVEDQEYYPLSSAQKRMYVINRLEENDISYNITSIMKVKGSLNLERLNFVFGQLVARHESFRTTFELVEGMPVQKVHKNVSFNVEHMEVTMGQVEQAIEAFIRPFDLSTGPLLRVGLIEMDINTHILIVDMHHIISDGTSIQLLIKEFLEIYSGKTLDRLQVRYRDYIMWQHNLINNDQLKEQETYWKEQFQGDIPILNLPTDYPRPPVFSHEGNSLNFQIGQEITEKLKLIGKQQNATLYMVLLAAYNTLLYKYTGQEEIVVGSPIAGRPHADLEHIVGMFVNTLALKNRPQGNKSFTEFLREVKEVTLEAFKHQDYPFEELVETLDIQRDMSRNPLFDTLFTLQNMDMEEIQANGLEMKPYDYVNNTSKFDVSLTAVEEENNIEFELEYSTSLFRHDTMVRFQKHFVNLLTNLSISQEQTLDEVGILSSEETDYLLYQVNNTNMEYPKEKTIHKLFEEQVEQSPNRVAIVAGESRLTYQELNERANQLARTLRSKGIGPDTVVAIMTERNTDMLVGLLSILKAGGAYLPIDQKLPKQRIEFMLRDSKTGFILGQEKLLDTVEFEGNKIYLDSESSYHINGHNLEEACMPNNLAYVIYTSGSTGTPKGVMIEHQSVNNFVEGMSNKLQLEKDMRMLSLTSISFDIFVLETIFSLVKGLRVVIASSQQQLDIQELDKLIKENSVNIIQSTPSRMRSLLELKNLPNIEKIIIGGEALGEDLVVKIKQLTGAQLYNVYGPTETTIWSTLSEIGSEETTVNIGKPIANTRIYIC